MLKIDVQMAHGQEGGTNVTYDPKIPWILNRKQRSLRSVWFCGGPFCVTTHVLVVVSCSGMLMP